MHLLNGCACTDSCTHSISCACTVTCTCTARLYAQHGNTRLHTLHNGAMAANDSSAFSAPNPPPATLAFEMKCLNCWMFIRVMCSTVTSASPCMHRDRDPLFPQANSFIHLFIDPSIHSSNHPSNVHCLIVAIPCLPLWSHVCTVQNSSPTSCSHKRHAKVHCKEPTEAERLCFHVGDAHHMLTFKECQGDSPDIAMSMFRSHCNEGTR